MIRSYKSWSGFFVVTLLGIVTALGLVILLIRGLLVNYNNTMLIIVLMILVVVTIAFANFTTLRLKNRVKEIYLRKLHGAKDHHIILQLLMESLILSGFIVVSGLVLAELISPYGNVLGMDFTSISFYIWQQILIIIVLVVPLGLLGSFLPIKGIINYVKKNFTSLSHRKY